ncbi:hypothetical protein TRVA0_041S01244 [Trichomonascus vanleenenianus]|uniref:uncharacterized protein n=1 Tax=Trichomonascus vanleenenianus TaxID=2268995 RepID=UPI003ECB8BF8
MSQQMGQGMDMMDPNAMNAYKNNAGMNPMALFSQDSLGGNSTPMSSNNSNHNGMGGGAKSVGTPMGNGASGQFQMMMPQNQQQQQQDDLRSSHTPQPTGGMNDMQMMYQQQLLQQQQQQRLQSQSNQGSPNMGGQRQQPQQPQPQQQSPMGSSPMMMQQGQTPQASQFSMGQGQMNTSSPQMRSSPQMTPQQQQQAALQSRIQAMPDLTPAMIQQLMKQFSARHVQLIQAKLSATPPEQHQLFLKRLYVQALQNRQQQQQQQQQQQSQPTQLQQQQQPQSQQQQQQPQQQQAQTGQQMPQQFQNQLRATPSPKINSQSPFPQNQSQHASPAPSSHLSPQTTPHLQPQKPAMQQQQQPQDQMAAQQQLQAKMESFMKSLLEFMERRGTPITSVPMVCNKRVHLFHLYGAVAKFGGSKKVSSNNAWPNVAMALGFNLNMNPDAPSQTAKAFASYLAPFEEAFINSNQQIRARMSSTSISPPPATPQAAPTPSVQQQPAVNLQQQQQQQQQQQSQPQQMQQPFSTTLSSRDTTPKGIVKSSSEVDMRPPAHTKQLSVSRPKPLVHLPQTDGKYTPKKRIVAGHGGHDMRVITTLGVDIQNLAPEFPLPHETGNADLHAITMSLKSMINAEVKQALDKLVTISADPRVDIVLQDLPGLLEALVDTGNALVKELLVPNNTRKQVQDMSQPLKDEFEDHVYENEADMIFNQIRSNFTDDEQDLVITVSSSTGEPLSRFFPNEKLLSLAEEVVVNNKEPRSGDVKEEGDEKTEKGESSAANGDVSANGGDDEDIEMDDAGEPEQFGFENYLDVLRQSREEAELIVESADDPNYFWRKAREDRLICILTIIRNLSFYDPNKPRITYDAQPYRFIMNVLTALAQKPRLLMSTYRRRLDVMKDLVTILANAGHYVFLKSASDALAVLLFALAFAPRDEVFTSEGKLIIQDYIPSEHKYFGSAVDIVAKIIPRDPPNKELLKAIFLEECTDPKYLKRLALYFGDRPKRPHEIMSRLYSMMISVVPRSDFRDIPPQLDLRKPILHQALLVAETLTEMIPEVSEDEVRSGKAEMPTSNIALSWLDTDDGFGTILLRCACALGAIVVNQPVQPHQPKPAAANPFSRITQRAIAILRTLGHKGLVVARIQEENAALPPGVLPTLETILGAMIAGQMDKYVVSQMCVYSEEAAKSMEF